MNKLLANSLLALSLLTSLSACGNLLPASTSLTAASSDSSFLTDVFNVLDADQSDAAKPDADKAETHAKRWQQLRDKQPELAAKLEALKDLSPADRKAKLAELFKGQGEHFKGRFGPGMAPPHFAFGARPPQGAFGEHPGPGAFGNHPAPNPELLAAMKALKDLSPEERKSKFEALRKDHPDWFPARPAMNPAAPAQIQKWFEQRNPELAAALKDMKDLTPEARKAKFEALRKDHPDWFPQFGPHDGAKAPGAFRMRFGHPKPPAAQP